MAKRGKSVETTISGIVIPIEWDDDDYGDATSVTIQTSDEEEYLVDKNKKGKELLAFIEEEVEVTGTLREAEDGNFIIKINEFSLI